MTALEKLTRLASDALGSGSNDLAPVVRVMGEAAVAALHPLLALRDGFYAFENALHVFPWRGATIERGIVEWNAPSLWRGDYGGMADGLVFFAEDAFGCQFALRGDAVVTFDPETGETEELARGLEAWAARLLEDYRVLTAHPIAHDWQVQHGAIPRGARLVPTTPFVLGGAFAVDNLRAVDAVEGMRFRAHIATQIRDLPDGAKIRLVVED
jgi:hypothetical protein